MSWVQLLAVSKSIDSVPDRPSPYKMTQQNLLPKFGTERGERFDDPNEGKCEAKGDSDVELFRGTQVVVAGGRVSPPAAPAEGAHPREEEAAERWKGWRLFRAWNFWGRRTRRGLKREAGEAVQVELALDMVRVVRNDLMEDDLMVVPNGQGKSGWRRWVPWEGGGTE